MTHKEILEQTKSELDRLVSEAKRNLDELNELQPVDKFAELKKAHKNGAVIQFKSHFKPFEWIDDNNPSWSTSYEYRIKPEEKTTLDQDIRALKEKYPNLKFTITVEDNL